MKTLNELFNSGVKDFSETKAFERRTYKFKVDGKEYIVSIVKTSMTDAWNIVFSGQDKNGYESTLVTGQGNELKVFASVVNIIKNFIKKNDPLVISFFAKEGNRSKLYDRMVKRFAKGYTVKTSKPFNDEIMYRLSKK